MTFKTLEQRFLEQKNIYTQFPARTTVNSQPYVTITPDSPQSRGRIKDDNYALPVVSTQRDFERIKKFLASSNGKLFIAKQLLLQTGNTFADTKIYNPASPLLNTVPFLHIKRHISTSAVTQRIPGLLQVGTVTAFTPSPITQQYTGFRDFTRNFRNTITALGRNELRNAVGRIGGGLGNLLTAQTLGTSRPEFVVFGTANYNPRLTVSTTAAGRTLTKSAQVVSINNIKKGLINSAVSGLRNRLTRFTQNRLSPIEVGSPTVASNNSSYPTQTEFLNAVAQFKNAQISNKGKFQLPPATQGATSARGTANLSQVTITGRNTDFSRRFVSPYFNGNNFIDQFSSPRSMVTYDNNNNVVIGDTKKNIGDTLNTISTERTNITSPDTDTLNYKELISQSGLDIINFLFTVPESDHTVRFRAFISQFKENVKPEFNEQQYIGRTERYVTYSGVRRTATLSFNIVAFSDTELDGMWSRINFLTGLAFPRNVSPSGFMIPPLFKISVGGIYDLQPCYIDTLDFDFLDESITFDIDKEVSKLINVNLGITLLEKRSKYYESPFYRITEDIAKTHTRPTQAGAGTRSTP